MNLHPKNDIRIHVALYYVLVANSILQEETTSLLEKAKMSSCCTKSPVITINLSLRFHKFNWKLYKKRTRS